MSQFSLYLAAQFQRCTHTTIRGNYITVEPFATYLPVILAPSQQWVKTFGTQADDGFSDIKATSDGGYIIAGSTGTQFPSGWLVKVDPEGSVVWEKSYGLHVASFNSILQTSDGGYVAAGIAHPTGHDNAKGLIVRLDWKGDVVWSKAYGGWGTDMLYDIQQTSDGGYIAVGSSSTDANNYPNGDAWVLRLDNNGHVVWQKTFASSVHGGLTAILQTSDGGYIAVGSYYLSNPVRSAGWIVRLDSNGNTLWQRHLGGGSSDGLSSIIQTKEGGYLAVGHTWSYGPGKSDLWVIKLNSSGAIQWQKAYGGAEHDSVGSVIQLADGDLVLVGSTTPHSGAWSDVLVMRLSVSGAIEWQKAYGATLYESGAAVMHSPADGNLVVIGTTGSYGAGRHDGWILKLGPNGGIPGCALVREAAVGVTSTFVSAASAFITSRNPGLSADNIAPLVQNISSTKTDVCSAR